MPEIIQWATDFFSPKNFFLIKIQKKSTQTNNEITIKLNVFFFCVELRYSLFFTSKLCVTFELFNYLCDKFSNCLNLSNG